MSHDLLRVLCLGGMELRFESRAVSPTRPLLLLSLGQKPLIQGGVERAEVLEGTPGSREMERL